MRGYDRDQVAERLQLMDAELRVLAADRDAATANAREIAAHLDESRDEISELRSEIDRLSVPPTTVQGMSERLGRMLQLASDEASEIRAEAAAEAAETVSVARQEAEQLKAEAETEAQRVRKEAREAAAKTISDAQRQEREAQQRADALTEESKREAEEAATLIAERKAAMEAEHNETMTAAREEARRIVTKAKGEAAELELQSTRARQSERERHDAEIAEQRDRARHETSRLKDTAHQIAVERLSRSRDLAAKADVARKQLVEQLNAVREQLSTLPEQLVLANEPDLTSLSDYDDIELLNKQLSTQSQIKRSSKPAVSSRDAKDSGESAETTKDVAQPTS